MCRCLFCVIILTCIHDQDQLSLSRAIAGPAPRIWSRRCRFWTRRSGRRTWWKTSWWQTRCQRRTCPSQSPPSGWSWDTVRGNTRVQRQRRPGGWPAALLRTSCCHLLAHNEADRDGGECNWGCEVCQAWTEAGLYQTNGCWLTAWTMVWWWAGPGKKAPAWADTWDAHQLGWQYNWFVDAIDHSIHNRLLV